MHRTAPRSLTPLGRLLALGFSLLALVPALAAQVPGQGIPSPNQLPSPQQAQDILRNQPALVEQLRQRIRQSGLTPDQVRSRLRASGYPEGLLDDYLVGADTTKPAMFGPKTLDAVRALGVVSADEADSLSRGDSLLAVSDSLRELLDSLRLERSDSIRADSLADSLKAVTRGGLKVFGLETFRRTTNRFQPAVSGPVDENYKLGPGDQLVLILTGDVEQAYSLEVTREGFIIIPQVGQVYAANLTLGQLNDQLYTRLGRVYSGVRRAPNARTKFQLSLAKLRSIQVYVAGDVVRPGAYQISAAGTALTALYAAGGPTSNGSFRQLTVRRGEKLVDSLDLYQYMIHGVNPTNIRLDNGDVVFVPVHSAMVQVAGKVVRPAIYETKPGETLRDVLGFAGGLDPAASEARVQINRILPPESRGGGRARVVVAVGADQFAGGIVPAVPIAPGDSITALSVPTRQRGYVTVKGNVWVEGQVGFTPGMKLSDALRLAGGPRPDVYLDRVLVTRVRDDSSLVQLRASLADSTGRVRDDLTLQDEDEIRVFSRMTFRPEPMVAIVGAVRRPGRVPYREGMTLRDAILLANGLTEDAQLEVEVARLPAERPTGALAQTMKVSLDSTYLFARRPGDIPTGSDGAKVPASGAPDTPLQPYDNVLVLRQAGWDLQRTVVIAGQVKAPGRYALRTKTERLSDLIERAGGLTTEAYAGGIEFYRAYDGNRPTGTDRLPSTLAATSRRDSIEARQSVERVGIDLPGVLRDPKDRDNIILASGDSVYIPEYNPVVMVQGAVNSPGAVAYTPGKNLDWYVNAAGGYTQTGDKDHPYVTQPDGQREGVKRRTVFADHVPKPRAGAVVYVATKTVQTQPSNIIGVLGTAAQVLGSLITIILVARQ
jgi:protein involved in polysaccharide export with SLBB domain